MGNQISAVEDLVKQLESTVTLDALSRLIQLVPYWQPSQEGRLRELHDFKSPKLLPNTLAQLAVELAGVNIAAREYGYEQRNVCTILHCLDLLLSSKAMYKQLPKQDLAPLALALQASVRRGDDGTALQAANAIRVVVERVGCRERKTGKEHHQVAREADAKARIISGGSLIEVLLDACAFLHPRSNPLVADAILRIILSLLCTHQDTTPFSSVAELHAGLSAKHLPLLFELSRHEYPRLRVAACGLLKGLFMEGDAASAVALQTAAIEWGALVWHLRRALAPAAGDTEFANAAPYERQLCERLWREVQVPLASGLSGSGTGTASGTCLAHGPLIATATDELCADSDGWTEHSPAYLGKHVDHRMAREASRELVSVFCFRNAAVIATVQRMLPAGFVAYLFPPANAAVKGPAVSLLDATGVCDDAMFFSPRSRLLWPAPLDVAASPSKKAAASQQPPLPSTPVAPALLSTSLWSGDADVPVSLGRAGCLWWDAALSSPTSNKAQRLALAARVKVAWLDVTPQVHAEHSGPSAEAAGAPASVVISADSVPPPPPPPPSTAGRYEPTILVVQCSAGGPQWRSLWGVLTNGPILAPVCVWTRTSLAELRDCLWSAEAGLDRRRRAFKRQAEGRKESGASVMSIASVVAGAATSLPVASAKADATRAWFGYEEGADRSLFVPDTPQSTLAAGYLPWDAAAFEVHYPSLESLLRIDGIYIAHLLPALVSATAGLATAPASLPPSLPISFPRSTLAALSVEENPRRRLALLQTLRVLAAGEFIDPCAEEAKWDAGSIPRLTGCARSGEAYAGLISVRAFEAPELVNWCAQTAAACTVGLSDICGGAPEVFGCIAGSDGAFVAAPGNLSPVLAGVFGHVVRPHCVRSPGSAAGARQSATSVLWPGMRAESNLAGGGEQRYWLELLRSECVLLLRLLLTLPTNARYAQSGGLLPLLQLLLLPADTAEELAQPAPPGATSPTENEASAPQRGPEVPMDDAADAVSAYRQACARFYAETGQEASRNVISASDALAVGVACGDIGFPGASVDTRAIAHPFPSAALQLRRPAGAAPTLSTSLEEVLVDPDELLVLRRAPLPRAVLGRAAAEALLAAVRSWPPVAQRFAREDAMQCLILPLLHAPAHPRLVGAALRLLRSVLSQIPLYYPALPRHALTQALLLTSLPAKSPRSGATSSAVSTSATVSDSGSFVRLGLGTLGGLCADAATLLHETHLASHDAETYGWAELASTPPRVAARLLIDESDTGIAAPPQGHRGPAKDDRSWHVFRWTSGDAKSAEAAATSASSLAPFLPAALIRVLQENGPEAFARVFNSTIFASPTCLWSSDLRSVLLASLLTQMKPLISWVKGASGSAAAELHPCAPIDAHARIRAVASGVLSISQSRALTVPYPLDISCSASRLLCVPPTMHTPVSLAVVYPTLEEEPRVGGIYLRVYAEGHGSLPAGHDSAAFFRMLTASLHREIAAVTAAHLAAAKQILVARDDHTNPSTNATLANALQEYRRAHQRTLLTLQGLRRLLVDSPGIKLEADSFAALGSLFGTVFGRYPNVAARGVLPPPPGAGDCGASCDVPRLTPDGVFTADALPPLPLSLLLLLPPSCVAACDPEHHDIVADGGADITNDTSAADFRPPAPTLTPSETELASPAGGERVGLHEESGAIAELGSSAREAVTPPDSERPSASAAVWLALGNPQSSNPFAAAVAASSLISKPVIKSSNPFDSASTKTAVSLNPFGAPEARPAAPTAVTSDSNAAPAISTSNPFGAEEPKIAGVVAAGNSCAAQTSSSDVVAAGATSASLRLTSELFAEVRSAAHAAALRGILIGRATAPERSDFPANSAAAGVCPRGTTTTLLGLALDVVLQSILPGGQKSASRKVCQAAAEGRLWSSLAAFVAWAVPLHAAHADSALEAAAFATAHQGAVLPSAGTHFQALSPAQRLRHYICAPLSVSALRLLALAVGTDPGTQLMIEQPQLIVPIVRAARIPWADAELTVPAPPGALSLPWLPTERMHLSAALRIAEPALSALHAVASVFALRRPLLDMGVPPLLLQIMVSGPPAPPGQKLSTTAMTAVLARRPAALARDAADAAASGMAWVDDISSFDLEDLSGVAGSPAESAHVAWLWPLRQAAEETLRFLCDKSGSASAFDETSAPLTGLASIAEEAANEMMGAAEPSPYSRSSAPQPARKKSTAASSRGTALSTALSSSKLGIAGSFAVTAAERSVRGALPLVTHLQATTTIINVTRNLVTPGVFRMLCPSVLDALATDGAGAAAPQSVIGILRGIKSTELPHVIWTPVMHNQLIARLSQEALIIDRKVLSTEVYRRLTGVDASASFGYAALPSSRGEALLQGVGSPTRSASNPFSSPGVGNPFDAGSSLSRHPSLSSVGASSPQGARPAALLRVAPSQAPVLWTYEDFESPDFWRSLYPQLSKELVLLGVYVRVYMRASSAELDALRPSPADLTLQILRDADGILSAAAAGRRIPEAALTTLTILLVALSEIIAVKPSVLPRAVGCLHSRVIPALIARDVWMQLPDASLLASGNPFAASPASAAGGSNPFAVEISGSGAPSGGGSSSAVNNSASAGWLTCLHAILRILVTFTTYTPAAEATAPQLHALHCIVRREQRAMREQLQGSSPPPDVSSLACNLSGSLASLQDCSSGLLALAVIAQTLRHAPSCRAVTVSSGLLAAVMALATSALQPQRSIIQLVSWQALAAACGAVSTSKVVPSDSPLWQPTPESACALLVPPAGTAVEGGSPSLRLALLDDDTSPAAYVCAVCWPLFDIRAEKSLAPLAGAWAAPAAAAARWTLVVQHPLLVWSDDTRADVSAFLQQEWALVDEWLAAHPAEPYTQRSSGTRGVVERLARPSIDRALCIGGVFVRPFNAQPQTRDVDFPVFTTALTERLSSYSAELLAASSSARGGLSGALTVDATDVVVALQGALAAFSDGRCLGSDSVIPAAVGAVLSCLHASLPPTIVLAASSTLAAAARLPTTLAAFEQRAAAVVVRLLHLLCVCCGDLSRGASAAQAAEGAAAAFALTTELVQKSDTLARAVASSPLVPHIVRAILSGGGRAGGGGRTGTGAEDPVALAAAAAASALAASGPSAVEALSALLGPAWAADGVWERRPAGILEYAGSGMDAAAPAAAAVITFLDTEIGALETVLRGAGAAALSAGLAKWDPAHARAALASN